MRTKPVPFKFCNQCNKSLPVTSFNKDSSSKDGHFCWCRSCMAEYKRQWYSENKEKVCAAHKEKRDSRDSNYLELRRLNRQKNKLANRARANLSYHLKQGNIIKPDNCSFCNIEDDNLHGHHEDYTKYLDVNWVCSTCHGKLHRTTK